jgi:hypothetical protein
MVCSVVAVPIGASRNQPPTFRPRTSICSHHVQLPPASNRRPLQRVWACLMDIIATECGDTEPVA